MEEKYDVIYAGKLKRNISFEHAVKQVSLSFKISKEKAEAFVSSNRPKVIKKDVTLEIAKKYFLALTKMGLEMRVNRKPSKVTTEARQIENSDKPQKSRSNYLTQDLTKNSYDAKTIRLATDTDNISNEESHNDKKRITGRPLIVAAVCILLLLCAFIFNPLIFTTTYTQEETYKENNIWYEKSSGEPLDGVVKNYHKQFGTIASEITYKNGQKHGSRKVYSLPGHIVGEETYKNGKRHGKSKKFRNSGELESLSVADNGRIVSMETYDSSGQISYRLEFNDEKKSHEYSYSKGKLEKEIIYLNGQAETILHHN